MKITKKLFVIILIFMSAVIGYFATTIGSVPLATISIISCVYAISCGIFEDDE